MRTRTTLETFHLPLQVLLPPCPSPLLHPLGWEATCASCVNELPSSAACGWIQQVGRTTRRAGREQSERLLRLLSVVLAWWVVTLDQGHVPWPVELTLFNSGQGSLALPFSGPYCR